jgi:hypothetical protein
MTIQRTMTAPNQQKNLSAGPAGDDGSAGTLLQQAQGFAQVAREALRDCERGVDAERELQNRRNQSGQ